MYIVLNPHSATNPTDKFRVVDNQDWVRYVNGEQRTYAFSEHGTRAEASDVQRVNNQVGLMRGGS